MTIPKPAWIGAGVVALLIIIGIGGVGGYRYVGDLWAKTLKQYKDSIDATYQDAFKAKQAEIDKLTKQVTALKKDNTKLKAEQGILYGQIDSLNFIIANMKPPENIEAAKKMLEGLGFKVVERP